MLSQVCGWGSSTAVLSHAPPRIGNRPLPARYRIGIIYNNENDCLSVDAGFGIGGDCVFNVGVLYM